MKKQNKILLFLSFLILGSGISAYAQTIPVACGNTYVRYGVMGQNGTSVFDWTVEGATDVIIYDQGDSVDILWNDVAGAHLITIIETSIYGCEGDPYQETIMVSVPFIDLGLDVEVCSGESYEFIASGADIATYLWQDDSDEETLIASTNGQYWVRVTDNAGCIASDTALLNVHDLPIVDLGPDTTNCGTEGIEFDVSDVYGFYEWHNGSASPYYLAELQIEDQEVWVNVIDDFGCVGSDTVIVRSCGILDIPNVFTPNGDGANDLWEIEQLFGFDDLTLDIYNRFGERVFHSDGYSSDNYWDGNDQKGKKLQMDSYYYVIDLHNGEEPIVGSVTIIR